MLTATLLFLSALVVQVAALLGLTPRRPIADEGEYLRRGASEDPYAPDPFLRAPALPWLAARCSRGGASAESRLRVTLLLASAVCVPVTVLAGSSLGGPGVGLLAGLILLLQPERVLLGNHIWPDTLLALAVALLDVLLVQPWGADLPLLFVLGGLCAIGFLTRVDFIVVPPLVAASLLWSGRPISLVGAVVLFAPLVVVAVLYSERNRRRYGIALPDTTWAFNLMLGDEERRMSSYEQFDLSRLILATRLAWKGLSPGERQRRALESLRAAASTPIRSLRGLLRRIVTLLGPDTFIRQKLLPEAYPELAEPLRRRLDFVLRICFPLLVSVVLLGLLIGRSFPGSYAWPAIGLLGVAALFHVRSRYRIAALPTLSLMAAQGLVASFEASRSPDALLAAALLGALAIFALLLRLGDFPEVRRHAVPPRETR